MGYTFALPRTSALYPGSPGWRWIATGSNSNDPTASGSPASSFPPGRWTFSFAGLPSDAHPETVDEEPEVPYNGRSAYGSLGPGVVAFGLYFAGWLGEMDGYKTGDWRCAIVGGAAYAYFLGRMLWDILGMRTARRKQREQAFEEGKGQGGVMVDAEKTRGIMI